MTTLKCSLVSLACLSIASLVPSAAFATSICSPLTGANPTYVSAGGGCNELITISSSGVVTIAITNPHGFDGSDDQYVGILNNSLNAITAVTLTGKNRTFYFDHPGIDHYGITGNATDTTTYGGTNAYFTGIDPTNQNVGTVNFIVAIAANGGTGAFSLEKPPTSGSVAGQTPEPSSLILLGTGFLAMVGAARRRLTA